MAWESEWFGRQVALQLGGSLLSSDQRLWEELKVKFNVELTIEGEPNSATIEVYGLSADSIIFAEAQDPDLHVHLYAGYNVPSIIFAGVATNVEIEYDGRSRVLRIDAEDEDTDLTHGFLGMSYVTQKTAEELLNDAIGQGGFQRGFIELEENPAFPQGYSYNGDYRRFFDKMAQLTRTAWSIQDGALQFVPYEKAVPPGEVLLSSRLGTLIGAPEHTEEGIIAKGLLVPYLRPGQEFEVEALQDHGLRGRAGQRGPWQTERYKAVNVRFEGGKYESEFYVIVEGEFIE